VKVVVLTGDQSNQRALCNKLTSCCEVEAIVLSENIPKKKNSFSRRARLLINRIWGRTLGWPFIEAWNQLLTFYSRQYHGFPAVPLIRVRNINDKQTLETIRLYEPDLIVVSGTNLVGREIVELANRKQGIVNLHTGISPYVKGGPNCTNWCLANNSFHLIGNTIMWLDAGIDTGQIIATEQTLLNGDETLYELHLKVMEHAHDLYLRAISRLAKGEAVLSVPQNSIAKGQTFYNADWNGLAIIKGLVNYHLRYKKYFLSLHKRSMQNAVPQLFPLKD
jgi:methionyl-tRNA formyltransferase